MADDSLTPTQTIALVDELESATRLVDLGVNELLGLDLANDFYHLPLQLLAQGLERFLKLTHAMAEFGAIGAFPTRLSIRRFGHDLCALAEVLVSQASDMEEYASRPAARQDLNFIRSDEDLRRVLALLTDFGKQGRYHRLDEFLEPDSVDADSNPYRRWEEFEMAITKRQPEWQTKISEYEGAKELQHEVAAHVAQLIDRFARAIARMWTLGALPDEARRYSGLLGRFLFLQDDALGRRR